MKWVMALGREHWRSAVAGVAGASLVVIVYLAVAALLNGQDVLIWIEAHPALAGWAQAAFSVIAILASSFFALWVPLHLRALSEQDAVQRAINSLLMLVSTTHSGWDTLRHMLQHREWGPRSGVMIRDVIDRARTMEALVPPSMQLGEALTAVARCRTRLLLLTEAVAALEASQDLVATAERIPFPDILGELEETLETCADMKPLKVAGAWMIFAPGDANDHAEIERAAGVDP